MRRITLAMLCVLISYTGSACGGYSSADRGVVSKKSIREKGARLVPTKVVSYSEVRQEEEVKKVLAKVREAKPKGNDKSSNNKQSREWKRAVFQGLTVGKSTEEDLLRVLGVSKRDPMPYTADDTTWYLYYTDTPFKGYLNIEIDAYTKKIEHISISPMGDLSVDEVIKYYGRDYVVTKYASDLCLEDDMGASPSYESPEGNHSLIEYRSLGISISSGLSMGGQEKVTSIDYRDGPFGAEKAPCIELETGSQGQVQECRDWGAKCWTPYETVHCHFPETLTTCYIYVKPEYFNRESMSNLARHFSKWSPEIREGVVLYLYDDKSLIESFIRSGGYEGWFLVKDITKKRFLRSGGPDPVTTRRGFYIRDYGRERLVYEKKNGKDEVIVIK